MIYITPAYNRGARIGHQFVSWGVTYLISQRVGIKFVHSPFSGNSSKWESFLQFGHNELNRDDLREDVSTVTMKSGHVVDAKRLSRVADNTLITMNKPWGFRRQIGDIADCIRRKYHSIDRPSYDIVKRVPHKLNVAVHVRRGDLTKNQHSRLVPTTYYCGVLERINKCVNSHFFIYSEGLSEEEIASFKDFDITHCCQSDMVSFHHMATADLLVVGNSGFSIFAGLCNPAPKISIRSRDWPGWIITDEWGRFDMGALCSELDRMGHYE